jgi:hypothetical protein
VLINSTIFQFINLLAGRRVTAVGHDLHSCTKKVALVRVPYPPDKTHDVVLLDTPGFNDTFMDDTKILNMISKWLANKYVSDFRHPSPGLTIYSYRAGKTIAGLIYLHDITHTRMLGTARKNFTIFQKLCGEDAFKNITLIMTNWVQVEEALRKQREKQLCDIYWNDMLGRGSSVVPFRNDLKEAWNIVTAVAEKVPLNVIQIQRELVDLGRAIPETRAGIALRTQLSEFLEQQRARARTLRKNPTKGTKAEYKSTVERIKNIVSQIQQLKVPISVKILRFLGLSTSPPRNNINESTTNHKFILSVATFFFFSFFLFFFFS